MSKHFETILKQLNTIDEIKSQISPDRYKSSMNKMYRYIKSIVQFYYDNREILPFYQYVRNNITIAEQIIEDKTIINTKVPFIIKEKQQDILDEIVHSTRYYLLRRYYEIKIDDNFIKGTLDINFADYCKIAAEYIEHLCKKNNIESSIIKICPGYGQDAEIYFGSGYHYFNIIKYNNKFYLIDTTYSQFFYANFNNLNRLGIPYISGCNPGIFMLMTDDGKNIANTIIQKGYIELNENILKQYLDAFTISYRNGLYYEHYNDFSYSSEYTIDDYIKFFNHEDSQIKREGREYLGFQTKPLKKSNLSFRRR